MTPDQIAAQVAAINAANESILLIVGAIAGVWSIIWLWRKLKLAVFGPGQGSRWM